MSLLIFSSCCKFSWWGGGGVLFVYMYKLTISVGDSEMEVLVPFFFLLGRWFGKRTWEKGASALFTMSRKLSPVIPRSVDG